MDDRLQRITRELKNELCPREVLDGVAARIARDQELKRRSHHRHANGRTFRLIGAAVLCLMVGFSAWQWQAHRVKAANSESLARAASETHRALIVQQTTGALAYIGQTLLHTAAHTENILSREAVPPLRNGFQTAKNKMTNKI